MSMLRNLRFDLLALANDLSLFLAIAPMIDPRPQIVAVAGASLGGKCTNKTCRLSKKPPAQTVCSVVFFGAKQCQPYHPHRQTINICVVYANSNNNNSKYLQQPADCSWQLAGRKCLAASCFLGQTA